WNSATVAPFNLMPTPVGSMVMPSARTSWPEWVMVTHHSAQAKSPLTSRGATSSSIWENASSRRSNSAATPLEEAAVVAGPQTLTSSVNTSATTLLSPSMAARNARTSVAALAALDVTSGALRLQAPWPWRR